MDWFRKRRELAALRRHLSEIKEELELIQRIRERVTLTKKALLVRQKNFVLRDLEDLIKDREELVKTMHGSNKLEFAERTESYKSLRDDIVSDKPIKELLKPLILKELKGVEFCLMLEKENVQRRITMLSLWTKNPCILLVVCGVALMIFGYGTIVRFASESP